MFAVQIYTARFQSSHDEQLFLEKRKRMTYEVNSLGNDI